MEDHRSNIIQTTDAEKPSSVLKVRQVQNSSSDDNNPNFSSSQRHGKVLPGCAAIGTCPRSVPFVQYYSSDNYAASSVIVT